MPEFPADDRIPEVPAVPDAPVPGPPPGDDPTHNPDVAHEHSDVSIKGLVWFGVIMLLSGVVVLGTIAGTFRLFTGRYGPLITQPQEGELGARIFSRPRRPNLQVSPSDDMAEWRAFEDRNLSTYGWADRGAGRVRIPIDRAVELALQRIPGPTPEDLRREAEAAGGRGGDLRGRFRSAESSSGRTWEARRP